MAEAPALRNRIPRSALRAGLVSGGLAALLLFAVYALRGIWPFGPDNVAYVDTAQFYLPGYYTLWDVYHGAPMNVSWFAGLAEGAAATVADLLDPADLVLLFIPRDRILEGLSLCLAVYLVEIALIAGLTVSIRFPRLPLRWQVVLALTYTFSGYVLQYYANFSWLWIAALFPLLLLGLERLLRDGRYFLYFAVYAYYLYRSVYFTYMVTAYILLFSFAYCVFLLPREMRGDRLFRLGASTAAAYGLTAYWWMWSSTVLTRRSRFQSNLNGGLTDGLTTWDLTNTRHTVLMLLGLALAAALLLRALRRQRFLTGEARARRAQTIRFFAFLTGALALPILFTNMDAAWHFGQYNFFPMRYGFMVPATLLAAAGLCLEEEQAAPDNLSGPSRNRTALRIGAAVLICGGLIALEPRLSTYFREYGACFLNTLGSREYWGRYFPLLSGCGLLFTGLYLLLLRSPRRRAVSWVVVGAALLQLGTNAYGLMAPSDDHTYTREYDPAYVEDADALYGYFSQQSLSPLSRAKNVDNSLNAGYPAIAGISALSSVNSGNSATRLGVFRELGYSVNYFRLLDTGGTVFSDMLLGVDTVLSARPLDDSLYADSGTAVAGIHIGAAKYPGVIGLTYRADALEEYLDILDLPQRLNTLYRAFTDSGEALAFTPDTQLAAQGEGLRTYTLTCQLSRDAFLYLSAEGVILNITAEGTPVPVPSYRNPDNTVYPAPFNTNLLYLGCFPAGPVTVTFTSGAELTAEQLSVTALDKRLVASFREDAGSGTVTGGSGENALTITVTADGPDRRLFLPLTWSGRWQCAVNNVPAQAEPVLGTLMSLPLEEGENVVTITRGPSRVTVTPGLLLTLGTLLLLILWLIVRRRWDPALPSVLARAVPIVFYAVFAAATAFLYLAPAVLFLLRGTVVRF